MKKAIFLVVLTSMFTSRSKAQALLKLYNDTLFNYEYAGGDEFNAPNLDESYWNKGVGYTRVIMAQDLAFVPEAIKQEGGFVKFLADKKDSLYTLNAHEIDSAYLKQKQLQMVNNQFLAKYSAGCIFSKQKFHYGLYELRFKVEEGRGVWPAFWFHGGYKNDEIDVFELKGEKRKQIQVDTHCPMGCDRGYTAKFSFSKNWGGWLPVKEPLDQEFNLMYLDWDVQKVNWLFNGYPMAYYQGNFNRPMNLYLNTSVAKTGGAFSPGPDESTKWPNTYTVDFIRVWKPLGKKDTLHLKRGHLENPDSGYSNKPLKKRGLTYNRSEFKAQKAIIYVSIDTQNILHLRVTGNLTESDASIHLTGETLDIKFNNLAKENTVSVPLENRGIQMTIIQGKKRYSRYLILK